MASTMGHVSIVNLLLDYGADINQQDAERETPLHHAVRGNSIDVTKLLMLRGADYKLQNKCGNTAYDLAKYLKFQRIMIKLAFSIKKIEDSLIN